MVAKSLKSAETLKKKGHQGKRLILPGKNPLWRKVSDLTHPLTQHSITTKRNIILGIAATLQHGILQSLKTLSRKAQIRKKKQLE